mgnify:CR=1 FL=1
MSHAVGFIGLGVMGRPMARFILAAQVARGGEVLIRDLDRARQADLIDAGALWAESLAELAQRCQIIIMMVPDINDVRALLDGPDGLQAHTTTPWTLVISSTCSPQEIRDLAIDLNTAGSPIEVVDAPVSGGAEGAEAGRLSIMVGGSPEAAALACDVLGAAGEAVHLGPLGSGQVAKACNQLIVAAGVVALAEASLLAERAGLDVAQLFEVLQKGYAGSRLMEVKAHRFVRHDHTPSGPARFLIKDLRAVAEEADQTGLALVSIDVLRRVFSELTEAGLGDSDTSVVQTFIEERSTPVGT